MKKANTITEVKEAINLIKNDLQLNTETTEVFDLVDNLKTEVDFCQEIDGQEYRFIQDSHIWDIYKDEIKSIVLDCYDLNLHEVPPFVAMDINWTKTAENCLVDGYGHTFSHYDGSETEVTILGYDFYIFRTN